MFCSSRLKLARARRKLSSKNLAELAGLSAVTLSKAENGHQVDPETASKIARALNYPLEFFFMDNPEVPDSKSVSFRSLKKMKADEREAALAAGAIGIAFYDWVDQRFNLPPTDLIDLSKERHRPEVAARLLRQHWGLGDRPIGSIIKLYESKGIRVLSLSENTTNVDAYSFWHAERPYIFLNQKKTAERSNFDAAHELAHLVLHFHAGRDSEKNDEAEKQADQFASSFLMPEADVKACLSHIYSASQIIKAKGRWKVSAMALVTRLHSLGMVSDWGYRTIIVDLGQRGYRTGEPIGVERETSTVLLKVFSALWGKGITRSKIADDLNVPQEEIEALIFDLAVRQEKRPVRSNLQLVT